MTIKHVTFDDYGTIAATALTTSYQNLITLTDDIDVFTIYNATDVAILVQVPSFTSTKQLRFPPGASQTYDFRINEKRMAKGLIRVRGAVGAGTTGEVTINVAR